MMYHCRNNSVATKVIVATRCGLFVLVLALGSVASTAVPPCFFTPTSLLHCLLANGVLIGVNAMAVDPHGSLLRWLAIA
ncbi:hypothetical protein GQ55_5G347200 [Panicum hallii var. hallii]|uniref:Uncharacterized protein n=1 Tax=Panicum hallii var. hallii TaxID=1504633 RepID=A0A2T7DM71_9POAL|nr:hypothetical protein GQ55_5G347200 [Panicum hallii var. hallii]